MYQYTIITEDNDYFASITRVSLKGEQIFIEDTLGCSTGEAAEQLAKEVCRQKEHKLQKRQEKLKLQKQYLHLSFKELVILINATTDGGLFDIFIKKVKALKEALEFEQVVKLGKDLCQAELTSEIQIGTFEHWIAHAKSGKLDEIELQLQDNQFARIQATLNQTKAKYHQPSDLAVDFLDQICNARAHKVVTLINADQLNVFTISEYGQVGETQEHRACLLTLLDDCLKSSGSMVIRQTDRHAPSSSQLMYGFYLRHNNIYSIAKEELKKAYVSAREDNMEFMNGEDLFAD